MSLVNLAHVCSHLQNASKARLGLTSVPSSNLILSLALALQAQGFLSSVTRGGPHPPSFLTATSHPAASGADAAEAQLTQRNVASRRLWLGLKYWRDAPVLRQARMVSKPKARITLGHADLRDIVRGRAARYVRGLESPGECLFVSTDEGVLEARECVERRVGGLALCRVI